MTRRLLASVWLVACGSTHAPVTTPVRTTSSAPSASASVTPQSAPARPSLEELVALAERMSPGTRELLRKETIASGTTRIELAANDKDTCVRIYVAADFPAKVSMESQGRELAAVEGSVAPANIAIGPRGPVCLRHGETSAVRIEGTGALQVVVRASP